MEYAASLGEETSADFLLPLAGFTWQKVVKGELEN